MTCVCGRPLNKADKGLLCRRCVKEAPKTPKRSSLESRAVAILHWKGEVVFMLPKPGVFSECGGQKVRPVYDGSRSLEKLPKKKVIDLDKWLPGYTREQVARMKGAVRPYLPDTRRKSG